MDKVTNQRFLITESAQINFWYQISNVYKMDVADALKFIVDKY